MIHVIVVDDELLPLEALENLASLVLPGATVTAFQKASKAVEFIEENPVDIAFLDITMRGISGIELAERLKEQNPRVNIIFCTGYEDYSLTAWELNSSGYLLKPITEEKLRNAVANLRYPLADDRRVRFQCFGNFEAYCDERPIVFKYGRTKELLAYLVDRNGANCSLAEIEAVLFESSDHRSYLNQMRLDLINTLTELGVQDVVVKSHGYLAVNRSRVRCDYYDLLDRKIDVEVYEYMTQYSFGEATLGWLLFRGSGS